MENERRRHGQHGQRVVPIRITHGIGETTGQYKKITILIELYLPYTFQNRRISNEVPPFLGAYCSTLPIKRYAQHPASPT